MHLVLCQFLAFLLLAVTSPLPPLHARWRCNHEQQEGIWWPNRITEQSARWKGARLSPLAFFSKSLHLKIKKTIESPLPNRSTSSSPNTRFGDPKKKPLQRNAEIFRKIQGFPLKNIVVSRERPIHGTPENSVWGMIFLSPSGENIRKIICPRIFMYFWRAAMAIQIDR